MSVPPRLKVGIAGAGAIGCYVGGCLLAKGAADVILVGRDRLRHEIAEHGLEVGGLAGEARRVAADAVRYQTDLEALADCDAVLVCVKSAQTADLAARLGPVLHSDALVVSLQNGVSNPSRLRDALLDHTVVPGIVSFNVVPRGQGAFDKTTSGPVMIETCQHPVSRPLIAAMSKSGIEVAEYDDLAPHQWTKLVVNLNNAVSALSGAPTRQLLIDPGYRRIIADVIDEAAAVLRRSGIRPARLRAIPVAWMPKILRLPTALVRPILRAQLRIAADARSSMWQDLDRRRPTEVDYLNGEIVRQAASQDFEAPLNQRIVELVHQAERAGHGSPNLSPADFRASLQRG